MQWRNTEGGQGVSARGWEGQAAAKRKGGQTEREGRQRGGEREDRARRGYTPEPVYGQKCGSPRLANRSGQGIV